MRLASAIGYAARKLWRRKDLEPVDQVILDLICEALQRIGHSYRPREGEGARQALARAPTHIQELVSSLGNLARPENPEDDDFQVQASSAKPTSLIVIPNASIATAEEDELNFAMPHAGPDFVDDDGEDSGPPPQSPFGLGCSEDQVVDNIVATAAADLHSQRSEDSHRETTANAGCGRSEDSQREITAIAEA